MKIGIYLLYYSTLLARVEVLRDGEVSALLIVKLYLLKLQKIHRQTLLNVPLPYFLINLGNVSLKLAIIVSHSSYTCLL